MEELKYLRKIAENHPYSYENPPIAKVELWDFSRANENNEARKEAVCLVASISYGNEFCKDPNKLWDLLVNKGHECYSPDTEVLTKEGWKKITDISYDDEIATLNPKNNTIEYHKPKRIFKYDYKGRILHFEARGIDLLVTPDHKVYVAITTNKNNKKHLQFELIEADRVKDTCHRHSKYGLYNGEPYFNNPYKAWLLGFFIGDGSYERGYVLRFHLKKKRKIEQLKKNSLLAGFRFYQSDSKPDTYYVKIDASFVNVVKQCFTDNKEKQIPQSLLFSSLEERLALLNGLLEADGSFKKDKGSWRFTTTSNILAQQIQQLCIHSGMYASISNPVKQKERQIHGKNIQSSRPIIRMTISDSSRYLYPEINRKARYRYYPTVKQVDYDGEIYCLEVPNHILMVRRNNKYVWSGNSVFEFIRTVPLYDNFGTLRSKWVCSYVKGEWQKKKFATFKLKVPIFVARQIQRHRAFSYMEMSRRYVKGEKVGFSFWKPQNYNYDSAIIKDFDYCREYDRRLKAGCKPEQARGCLPIETYTQFWMQGDYKAWLNFFIHRLHPEAQEETRSVAQSMWELLKEHQPEIIETMANYLDEWINDCNPIFRPAREKKAEWFRKEWLEDKDG